MTFCLSSRFRSSLLRLVSVGVLACSVPALLTPAALQAQALPNLGGTEGEELSPLMERKLGEQVMNNLRHDRDYLDDPVVLDYLNQFGNGLLTASPEARGDAPYDFYFFGIRDASLNAFAMPGGFIGVHTGLLLASQSESELASVLAHEIGHVSQRHIARMIGGQKQDALLPLAGLLVAVLAARTSPDLAGAALMGGSGLAAQRRLGFGRDAEREADRVGLNILNQAGFEVSGMVKFFGRLQSAGRTRNDNTPSYLRTHPLTTERIADIEARIRPMPVRQRADSLDFSLIKARARVLQDDTPQGWLNAAALFTEQLRQTARAQVLAAQYGLALIALRQRDVPRSEQLLKDMQAAMNRAPLLPANALLSGLQIDQRLVGGDAVGALQLAREARQRYPLARALNVQLAEALLAADKAPEAVDFLRDQAQLYRKDAGLQRQLARAYAASDKRALQHMTLAEYYALLDALPAALEQLRIARAAPDATFYDLAVIDAREREWQALWREISRQPGQAPRR